MPNDAVVGFAVRRTGDCLKAEIDCGTVQSPFRACCANGAFCRRKKGDKNIYVR